LSFCSYFCGGLIIMSTISLFNRNSLTIISKKANKMKKVLFVATVTKHINAFHIPYLKWFKENGYEVHVASNGEETIEYCDKKFYFF